MMKTAARLAAWALMLHACVLLAGCQTELYTKQTESDANQMLGALLENGLDASKKSLDGGKTWNVLVEESQIARAVALLKAAGLPSERYTSLGDLFKKDGLISTPTEERVRFIHGVSQELGDSLARIDGVLVARVHVVLPENDPLSTRPEPASASVFVKHGASVNTAALVPMVKNFVVRGVQGLSFENVSVTLIPAHPPSIPEPAAGASRTASQAWRPDGRASAWGIAGACLGVGLALGAIAGRRRPAEPEPATLSGAAAASPVKTASLMMLQSHASRLVSGSIAFLRGLLRRRS
jgi:type III secretion protein J